MERALKNNPQYAMEVIEGEYEDAWHNKAKKVRPYY